jgi:tRNA pseudouridine55 synthase
MPRQPQPAPFDGALVINKPKGKTSHDVVDAVRHLAGFRQIGHLGTLDPLATGVLVLLLGRATRLVQFYVGRRKRYKAGFRFGFATDAYDSDGEAQGPDVAPTLEAALLEKFAAERIGRFEQMPPSFSAKKVKGRPAYELARKKQPVELKAVEVELFEFKLTEIAGSIARFVIECSSGTYIRALANEMGQKLGCGAHLAEIERTAVGEFSLEQAIPLDELAEAKAAGKFGDCLIRLEHLLPNFPRVNVLPVIEKRPCNWMEASERLHGCGCSTSRRN